MTSVPVEERTSEFKSKLYQEAVQNDKYGRVTCVGKSIHKKSRNSSSSGIRQTILEGEELREQLRKLKEEREELKQIKEEFKHEREEWGLKAEQEREQLSLKIEQVNELIAMYGVPQSSPRFASCSPNVASQVPDASSTDRHVRHVLAPTSSIRIRYELALTSSIRALKDGVRVSLFGGGIPKDVVARGVLVSKDPEENVDNLPIGPDCWKVFLDEAKHPTHILDESSDNVLTVGHLVYKFVAWPIANIIMD